VPGGKERKTHKMIERDLMAARDKWLKEAKTDAERKRRLKIDFLCYCNHDGLYADFHSFRHLFITNLERAGIKPKMAQTLARHSDVRLTLGVYTHVTVNDQTAAIESLPGPPGAKKGDDETQDGKAAAQGENEPVRLLGTHCVTGVQNSAFLARRLPGIEPPRAKPRAEFNVAPKSSETTICRTTRSLFGCASLGAVVLKQNCLDPRPPNGHILPSL